jgi:hypothetical protein
MEQLYLFIDDMKSVTCHGVTRKHRVYYTINYNVGRGNDCRTTLVYWHMSGSNP